ncbi:MAG: hypothetical protein R3275_02935 [Saprospiraceae bacterium]|nr:hypothetical protein [Saprospiraceae bacterium]
MNMDIQPVILDFLSRRKSIDVPGWGRLFWTFSSPESTSHAGEIKGPSIQLRFIRKTDQSEEFVQYLVDQLNISHKRARVLIDNWVERAVETIRTNGKFVLEAIGTFESDGGDDLRFIPDQSLVSKGMELPVFTLSPVERAFQPVVHHKEEEVQSENGLWFRVFTNYIIPAVLIILILLLLFFLYSNLTSDGVIDSSTPTQTEIKKPEGAGGVAPITDDRDSEKGRSGDSVMVEKGQVADDQETLDDEEWKEEELTKDEAEDRLNDFEDRFCIIIVGSFKNQLNADRMLAKIDSMGLTSYTEPYGEYTRVGVKFDCYENDLYRRLFQLRGQFSQDAWILKYK